MATERLSHRLDDVGGERGMSTLPRKGGIRNTGMRVLRRAYAALAFVGALTACSSSDSEASEGSTGAEATTDEPVETTGSRLDAGTGDYAVRCATPPGHTGQPQSIAEAVAHIKALPAPIDVPCVLESFARPLPVLATSSVFSAQPGRGEASPRLFVFFDGLILSFATVGSGAQLVEFAEFVGPATTIKAELELPADADTIDVAAAITRVQDQDLGTVCRLCHRNEAPSDDVYPGSFASDALAPRADTIIELDDARMHAQMCDPQEDAQRCAILDAVFLPGDVIPGEFDPEIHTIFDYD